MISVLKRGEYKLIDTKNESKILVLDGQETFSWLLTSQEGEIITSSHVAQKDDTLLSVGNYRLYKIDNEPKYTDNLHLELQVGCGYWQGYLLPSGFPKNKDKSSKIISTDELLTATNNCCHHASNSL